MTDRESVELLQKNHAGMIMIVAFPETVLYLYNMYNFKICWDLKKAHVNLQKHGISFEEAKTFFWDECLTYQRRWL